MRMSFQALNKIKEKYGVDVLWSFSRFDSYRNSHYEYFLKYILKAKPLGQKDSAYAPIGGAVHDIIEKFYNNEIKYEDMINEFEDIWTINIDTLGFEFNKGDKDRNSSIGNKYYKDLQHFFTHYQPITHYPPIVSNVQCEQFLLIHITPNIIFQGYADAIYKDKEGYYVIEDYKTSTMYSGKSIDEHAAQLILYAVGLFQKGIPLEKIKVCWNFLKYVSVDFQQVNGKVVTSNIERCTLGEKLQKKAKVWLKKLGYENQSDELLTEMIETNSIDCLPDDVREKFTIRDCRVFIDDLYEKYDALNEEIINTITEINDKTDSYNKTHDDKLFWDDEDTCKRQSYYFANLSDYSIEQLKPYKEYLERLEQEKNDPLGMMSYLNSSSGKAEEVTEEDFSWLDELV